MRDSRLRKMNHQLLRRFI